MTTTNKHKGMLLYNIWLTKSEVEDIIHYLSLIDDDLMAQKLGKIIGDIEERGDFERR